MRPAPSELLPLTPELADSLAAGELVGLGPARVRAADVQVAVGAAQSMAAFYRRIRVEPPWIGYFGLDDGGEVVGLASFKGPVQDGAVEIAYFTFPAFEGRGHATRMAAALLQIAGRAPERPRVLAHTLQEENASTRLLRRLDFVCEGVVEDPEDGPVLRWSRAAPEAEVREAAS